MRHFLNTLKIPIISILVVFIYNEYFIYWHVLSKCKWPKSVNSTYSTNIMLLADTHLLGSRNGHWFDKLRREWQQRRAYQTSLVLFKPKYIIILGDLTDEGKWCSDNEWDYYVNRTNELFNVNNNVNETQLFILAGNHDMGFHYNLHKRLIERFNRSFTKQFVHSYQTPQNDFFIFLNSMTLENDKCNFCNQAQRQLKSLNYTLNCMKHKNCTPNQSNKYTRPIVFTHFPLYRQSDSICPVDVDSEPVEKREIFQQNYDCLSLEATKQLIQLLNPRLVFSGHTHYSCYNELNGVSEFTIPSFSWRNIKTPSMLLLNIDNDNYSSSKCFLPSEIDVYNYYIYLCVFLILYFIYQVFIWFKRFKKFKTK